MNFITLKELKKMVPVASEFKRVPGLKKILEDGIEVILRKQMENHAEVVVYKNGYVSYHAHERYTVLKENSTQIRNIKQYLLATLYNAPVTVDSYYSAQVRHEFGWGGRVDKN